MNKLTSGTDTDEPKIDGPSEKHELNLSADRQWLRLVVGGKQIASFHLDYVKKILAAEKPAKIAARTKKTELPASV